MGISIDGLDELMTTLDSLGDVGKKISTASLRKAMKPGLEILKETAPKDTSKGANVLRVNNVKQYKNGGLQGKMGIDEKNWEEAKHLWYQHFGYQNKGWNLNGKKVTRHVGWFDEACKKAEAPVLNQLEAEINLAIDNILR